MKYSEEIMEIVPSMVEQLNRTVSVLMKIQEAGGEVDMALLAEYETGQSIYLYLDSRFKHIVQHTIGQDLRRVLPTVGKNNPSKNSY